MHPSDSMPPDLHETLDAHKSEKDQAMRAVVSTVG